MQHFAASNNYEQQTTSDSRQQTPAGSSRFHQTTATRNQQQQAADEYGEPISLDSLAAVALESRDASGPLRSDSEPAVGAAAAAAAAVPAVAALQFHLNEVVGKWHSVPSKVLEYIYNHDAMTRGCGILCVSYAMRTLSYSKYGLFGLT